MFFNAFSQFISKPAKKLGGNVKILNKGINNNIKIFDFREYQLKIFNDYLN